MPGVSDILDIGQIPVDVIGDPSSWRPEDRPVYTSPEMKVISIVAFQAIPVAIYEAFKFHRIGAVYSWADDVIRESWLDDIIRSTGGSVPKSMRHGAKKKLVAKILLRFVPYIGWALAAYDIVQILDWIHDQLQSKTTATGTRGKIKKQMRSTSHKYSRRNNYYNKRKRYNRY